MYTSTSLVMPSCILTLENQNLWMWGHLTRQLSMHRSSLLPHKGGRILRYDLPHYHQGPSSETLATHLDFLQKALVKLTLLFKSVLCGFSNRPTKFLHYYQENTLENLCSNLWPLKLVVVRAVLFQNTKLNKNQKYSSCLLFTDLSPRGSLM